MARRFCSGRSARCQSEMWSATCPSSIRSHRQSRPDPWFWIATSRRPASGRFTVMISTAGRTRFSSRRSSSSSASWWWCSVADAIAVDVHPVRRNAVRTASSAVSTARSKSSPSTLAAAAGVSQLQSGGRDKPLGRQPDRSGCLLHTDILLLVVQDLHRNGSGPGTGAADPAPPRSAARPHSTIPPPSREAAPADQGLGLLVWAARPTGAGRSVPGRVCRPRSRSRRRPGP